jgi:hypothetical protein
VAFFAQKKIDFLILLAKMLEIFYEHRLTKTMKSTHERESVNHLGTDPRSI